TLVKILLCNAVLTVELVDTSTCCSSLLLSCIERMTLRTNFYVDFWFSRSCYKFITTVAYNLCLVILWMDTFFHDLHLFIFTIAGFQPATNACIVTYFLMICK